MTQEQFVARLHSQDPKHPTWARCRFIPGAQMADTDDDVTCGHCLRKLGRDPRKKLAAAVAALVLAYDGDEPLADVAKHIAPLVKAWHAERDYISMRRYQR